MAFESATIGLGIWIRIYDEAQLAVAVGLDIGLVQISDNLSYLVGQLLFTHMISSRWYSNLLLMKTRHDSSYFYLVQTSSDIVYYMLYCELAIFQTVKCHTIV